MIHFVFVENSRRKYVLCDSNYLTNSNCKNDEESVTCGKCKLILLMRRKESKLYK
jgi:hypothetical protein